MTSATIVPLVAVAITIATVVFFEIYFRRKRKERSQEDWIWKFSRPYGITTKNLYFLADDGTKVWVSDLVSEYIKSNKVEQKQGETNE